MKLFGVIKESELRIGRMYGKGMGALYLFVIVISLLDASSQFAPGLAGSLLDLNWPGIGGRE
ncbi:MAG: hypothetical protein ACU0DW_00600 [Shimia sp.]